MESGLLGIISLWEGEPLPSKVVLESLYRTAGAADILSGEDSRFRQVSQRLESLAEWYSRLTFGSIQLDPDQQEVRDKLVELARIYGDSMKIPDLELVQSPS